MSHWLHLKKKRYLLFFCINATKEKKKCKLTVLMKVAANVLPFPAHFVFIKPTKVNWELYIPLLVGLTFLREAIILMPSRCHMSPHKCFRNSSTYTTENKWWFNRKQNKKQYSLWCRSAHVNAHDWRFVTRGFTLSTKLYRSCTRPEVTGRVRERNFPIARVTFVTKISSSSCPSENYEMVSHLANTIAWHSNVHIYLK